MNRVYLAVVNSTDTGDGLDESDSAEFFNLASAERWINHHANTYLGASIDVVERRTVHRKVVDTEIEQRVYEPVDGRFVLDEIVELDAAS